VAPAQRSGVGKQQNGNSNELGAKAAKCGGEGLTHQCVVLRRVKGRDIEPMWSAFLEYQKQEEAEAAAEEAELEKAANE